MRTALILERQKTREEVAAIYLGSAEGLGQWKATDSRRRTIPNHPDFMIFLGQSVEIIVQVLDRAHPLLFQPTLLSPHPFRRAASVSVAMTRPTPAKRVSGSQCG